MKERHCLNCGEPIPFDVVMTSTKAKLCFDCQDLEKSMRNLMNADEEDDDDA